ncbi:MAG: DUF3995 domain-containing protein [Hyphomonadaceae bacterium]
MPILAISLTAIVGFIALLHLIWALGSSWPRENELLLARSVVGRKDIKQMPSRLASLIVAISLGGTAYWALLLGHLVPLPIHIGLVMQGGLFIAAIFITRGFVGFFPFFRRAMPEQPFARLNARYYSPLCLALGVGYGFLTIFGLTGLL